MMLRTIVWQGTDAPRMEIAHVHVSGGQLRATGTQIGATYELRYELSPDELTLQVVGGASKTVALQGADFFDLGYSPLFNTLPVLRDGMLDDGRPREYVMRWVSVPDLAVTPSTQVYEPLPGRRVRFTAGSFVADLELDADGFVMHYQGLARQVGEGRP